ncbi:MAG TPA: hypothetical protein VKE40_08545, partial [Gemmataceae bacterium]|nr:hypothetical protein [Gemmataceae bacterium]
TTGGRVHIGRLPMDRRRVLAVLGAALAGAARGPTDEAKRSPAEPASRSVSRLPAADLRNAADDPKVDRADRAAAVFALFANHLKPPCGSATAGAALGDAGWLASANLYEVRTVMGMIPVEFGGGATVFCLHVLPIKDGWSDWVIYLRLSGDGRTTDDARKFLRGGLAFERKPELLEFALCYPSRKGPGTGRIERFGPKGMTVMLSGD